MLQRLPLLTGLVLIVAACSGVASSSSSSTPAPTPSPTPSPTPGPALTIPQLKLAVINAYGRLWYCDPDFYPIQRGEEIDHARERWAEVAADTAAFEAIRADVNLESDAVFTDAAKLAVYQAWKILNAIALDAIALDPIGNDTYRFDYLAQPKAGVAEGTRTAGTITATGTITVEQQAPAMEPICPICLARGTLIETPAGGIAVDALRIGDPVWTVDPTGDRIAGTVIALGSTPVPADHHVVRLLLTDGRSVTASPGHPLADGRRIGELRSGDVVDGSSVVAAELIPYAGDATFDIVVSGQTGTYFADGIALGSTLWP